MKPLLKKLRVLFSSPSQQFYCSSCRTLVNESDKELHRELGHDVAEHPESYFIEIEESAGVLS